MFLSQLSHVRLHCFILCLEVSIPIHNLFLHGSGPHSVYSGFLENRVMDLFGDLEAIAYFFTIFENQINVFFHCLEITEDIIEVVEKVGGI